MCERRGKTVDVKQDDYERILASQKSGHGILVAFSHVDTLESEEGASP
jgi:hypothetical protein